MRTNATPSSIQHRATRWPALVLMVFLLTTGNLLADEFEFSADAVTEATDLGRHGGLHLAAQLKFEHSMGDYYVNEITIAWKSGTKQGEVLLFDGLAAGIPEVRRFKNTLYLKQWGNRYESAGWYMETAYHWNPQQHDFTPGATVEVDPWQQNRAHLNRLLEQGAFTRAFKLAAEMSSTPNGGHTYKTQELFEAFIDAAHRHGITWSHQGRIKQTARVIAQLLFSRLYEGWHDFDASEPHFSLQPQSRVDIENTWQEEPLFFLSATPKHTRFINDFAYWLLQSGDATRAEMLLQQVIGIAPERKAAWLNLADAQYQLKEFPWDETTLASYQTYITLMKREGRHDRIPGRVLYRIKEIEAAIQTLTPSASGTPKPVSESVSDSGCNATSI